IRAAPSNPIAVKTRNPGLKEFAPMRDIKARMPPSPLLSARMTNTQYLIDTVMINVHTTRERMPSAESGVNLPPVACTTVCKQYRGLVPRSPKTTPNALSAAHPPGCAGGAGWLEFDE